MFLTKELLPMFILMAIPILRKKGDEALEFTNELFEEATDAALEAAADLVRKAADFEITEEELDEFAVTHAEKIPDIASAMGRWGGEVLRDKILSGKEAA